MTELQIEISNLLSNYSFAEILADNPSGVNEKFLYLHDEAFGFMPTCNGCTKMIHNYNNLKKYSEMETVNPVSRFKLKDGFQMHVRSIGAVVMNANLTDEIALNIIAESSGNADLFIEKPEGWEKEVELLKALKGSEKVIDVADITNETDVTGATITNETGIELNNQEPVQEKRKRKG
jgi:hypothetical protein